MALPALVLCLALLAQDGSARVGRPVWTYGFGQHGIFNWGTMFKQCGGERQSPINIDHGNVKPQYWTPFTLKNYDQVPTHTRVSNNGHSVIVEIDARNLPRVGQGGLEGEYIFAQFHFHWGSDSSLGSDHTIDGVRYPMELHMVHYKAAYGSIGAAVSKPDGLAFLSAFLEVSEDDNPALTPLVTTLMNITDSGMFAPVTPNYPLRAFLPAYLEKFYRYEGSICTPTCNEVVTWTIFDNTIPISENQLQVFRSLKFDDGSRMVNNFRPPQPLNNRTVLVSSESELVSAESELVSAERGSNSASMEEVVLIISMAILMIFIILFIITRFT